MIDDDNPVFLSFADALTCVLGASIALFLIFVTLVKVAPPTVDPERVNLAQTGRLMGTVPGTGADAVVLRVASADCSAIQALQLTLGHESWWTAKPGRDESTCERIFRIQHAAASAAGSVILATPSTKPLDFVLIAGARRWPPAPRQWRIEPGTSCSDDGRIARLALSVFPPLAAEGCP